MKNTSWTCSLFSNSQWRILRKDETASCLFHLKWVSCIKDIDFERFNPRFQLVVLAHQANVVPGIEALLCKFQLSAILAEVAAKDPNLKTLKLLDTFVIRSAEDWTQLYSLEASEDWYLIKEESRQTAFATNISLVSEVHKLAASKRKAVHKTQPKPVRDRPTIVQKYFEGALQVNGFRHDLECLVGILSTDPLRAVFHPGVVRRASAALEFEPGRKPSKMMVSTNPEDHALLPDFNKIKHSLTMDHATFDLSLKHTKNPALALDWPAIKRAIVAVVQAWHRQTEQRLRGTFSLLKVTIIPSADLSQYHINGFKQADSSSTSPELLAAFVDAVLDHHQATQDPTAAPDSLKPSKHFELLI